MDIELARRIKADDSWRNTNDLQQSVPGVGKTTGAALIAKLPELGELNRIASRMSV